MSGTSGLPSWARVGVKVVCIDASPSKFDGTSCELALHKVYEIEEVVDLASFGFGLNLPLGQRVGLHLVGIGREVQPNCKIAGWERPFALSRFRPLVSDSDELGIETILYRKAGLKSKTSVRSVERA